MLLGSVANPNSGSIGIPIAVAALGSSTDFLTPVIGAQVVVITRSMIALEMVRSIAIISSVGSLPMLVGLVVTALI